MSGDPRAARETGPAGDAPEPAFSIPADRLAGSEACLNCGTRLQGPFCHWCGQPDRRLLRFFPAMLRDLLGDVLDLDSRVLRTLRLLLLRPGRLTRDYLEGRRSRYTPPIRLYLFASVLFFLLASLVPNRMIQIGTTEEAGRAAGGAAEALDEAAGAAGPEETASEETASEEPSPFSVRFNDRPWDRETNPVVLPFLPSRVSDWINDEIEESPQRAKAIGQDPRLFTDKMYEVLPGSMFVLLPLAALVFKFWYLFSKRYYFEHLVFALHAHAFVFLILSLELLVGSGGELMAARGLAWVGVAARLLSALLVCWIPLHFLLSLKRVYRQGWPMTLLKSVAIGSTYGCLLALATGIVAVASFLLV